ncbi:MAG: hypothetical protein A2X46_04950 [Lentisphaerae bacterium GWF2_57_35]|nr:MAG: hypothetical protein A2X46_04950 [Lentisphaerae bacterium GWF2_57_35]
MTVTSLITGIVRSRSHSVFLIDMIRSETYTFSQFDEWARGLAWNLQERGLKRGERIAFLLKNGADFAALYFACLYAGVVAVPVNPALSKKEIGYILEHAGLCEVIYDVSYAGLFDALRLKEKQIRLLCAGRSSSVDDAHLWWNTSPDSSAICITPEICDSDVYSLNFTSGTTGLPKGVPHRVADLFAAARAFNLHTDIGSNHRIYHILPMSYMAGFLNTLICPFVAGGSVVVNHPFSPQTLFQFWGGVCQYQVNTLWLVPTMLSALLRADRDSFASEYCRLNIRLVCVGTAPLPAKLKSDFEKAYGIKLYESYGLSETLFVAGNTPSMDFKAGSVGCALSGVAIRIAQDGEIMIQAPWTMPGYFSYDLQRPDVLSHSWFPSGDIGHLDEDGYLFITGRKKDLIIRGGQNISPRSVEEVLETHSDVLQVGVVGIPHAFYGEEVVAVVLLKPGLSIEVLKAELDAKCRQELSFASIPTRYVQCKEMPMSVTGKLQKNKLREWVLSEISCKRTQSI